jgi:hypothetical protein
MRRFLRVAVMGTAVGIATVQMFKPAIDDSWNGHTPEEISYELLRPGVVSVSSTMFGLERLRRMNIVKMKTGGLLIHSATCLPEELMKLLEDEGPVELIVVPCAMHRLDAALWKERFPKALVVCPLGAKEEVQKKVGVDATYESLFVAGNKYAVKAVPVPMKPGFDEAVLIIELPRPYEGITKAAIVTDFLQNIDIRGYNWFLRSLFSAYGLRSDGNTPTCSRGFRFLAQDGSAGIKKFLSSTLTITDTTALLFCHGEPIQVNASKRIKALIDHL